MRQRSIILLMLVALCWCCSGTKTTTSHTQDSASTPISDGKSGFNSVGTALASIDQLPDTALIIEVITSPCFGQCPVFEMRVLANGSAQFNGIKFTQHEGKHSKKLSIEEFEKVFSKADSISFFDKSAVYDAQVTDLPSTTVYLNNGKQSHRIRSRFGTPKDLVDFNGWVIEWATSFDWTASED